MRKGLSSSPFPFSRTDLLGDAENPGTGNRGGVFGQDFGRGGEGFDQGLVVGLDRVLVGLPGDRLLAIHREGFGGAHDFHDGLLQGVRFGLGFLGLGGGGLEGLDLRRDFFRGFDRVAFGLGPDSAAVFDGLRSGSDFLLDVLDEVFDRFQDGLAGGVGFDFVFFDSLAATGDHADHLDGGPATHGHVVLGLDLHRFRDFVPGEGSRLNHDRGAVDHAVDRPAGVTGRNLDTGLDDLAGLDFPDPLGDFLEGGADFHGFRGFGGSDLPGLFFPDVDGGLVGVDADDGGNFRGADLDFGVVHRCLLARFLVVLARLSNSSLAWL